MLLASKKCKFGVVMKDREVKGKAKMTSIFSHLLETVNAVSNAWGTYSFGGPVFQKA